MGVSMFGISNQAAAFAEAERLCDQHEAPTAPMQELRTTWDTLGFPYARIFSEMRALAQAGRWHVAGRGGAGASIQADSADVREDVSEVEELVGVYRRALEYAIDMGEPGAEDIASRFLPIRVRHGGFLGAAQWVVQLRVHYDQTCAKDILKLPPTFEERLRALEAELVEGRSEVHHEEQTLVAEASSVQSTLEGIEQRAARIWNARLVATDHTGTTYPGFDLAYLRAAVARRSRRRESAPEVDEPATAAPGDGGHPLPGLPT